MKKTLAILLSVLMVLSMAALGVSAAEATPVATAADFAAMAADGNYKLTADITIAETYATTFTGTFDGDGHTVTVSAPMFADVAGTVKNLTVNGAVDTSAAASFAGAVAATVSGNATFENITNNAPVKGYMTEYDTTFRAGAGGIVGTIKAGKVSFKDCVNNADITGHAVGGIAGSFDAATAYSADDSVTFTNCLNKGHINASDSVKVTNNSAAGGIIGICNKVLYSTFVNCENTGRVESDKDSGGPAGGIVAYIYTNKQTETDGLATFKNCKNSGEISTAASQAGGIAGWSRVQTVADNCVNTGYVHSGNLGTGVPSGYVGGIFCRAGSDSTKDSVGAGCVITNCINEGKCESGRDQVGGILAYHNGGNVTITNCTNKGNLGYVSNIADGKKNTVGGIIGSCGQSKGNTVVTVTGCVNEGELTSLNNNAGGIIGYVYGTSAEYAIVSKCVNTGKVVGTTFVNDMLGYTNTVKTTIEDCVFAGEIVAPEGVFSAVLGCSSADVSQCPVTGNKMIDTNTATTYYSYTKTEANAANIVELANAPAGSITKVTAAEAATAAKALNAGYKATATAGYVAPGTAPETPATGDTAIIAVVICAVSLLGMGIALKARKA